MYSTAPEKPRRIGLSRSNFKGPPLLSIRVPRKSKSSRSKSTSAHRLVDDESASNIPNSQSDDILGSPKKLDSDDDIASEQECIFGSDDEENPRGDIPVSNLARTARRVRKRAPLTKRMLGAQDDGPIREQHALTTSGEAEAGSSPPQRSKGKGRQWSGEKMTTEPFTSSAPTNMFGLLVSSQQSKKRKLGQQGYGSKSGTKVAPSSSFSSNASFKKPLAEVPSNPSTPRKGLKLPYNDDSGSPNERTTFKPSHGVDLESPGSAQKPFAPPVLLQSPSNPEAGPAFRFPDLYNSFDDYGDKAEPEMESKPEPLTPSRTVFRLPPTVEDIVGNLTSPIEERRVTASISNSADNIQEIRPPSSVGMFQPMCPMCGEIVDANFLDSYHDGRMNIKVQARFCLAHKKRSAREVWVSRGYPDIKWNELDRRIDEQHQYLNDLLEGASSYYRSLLKELMKSGKNRTLRQAMMRSGDSLTPGYYGSRGQRVMSDNIMKEFSPALRSLAVKDRLISAQGVAGYVQAVLVPELAVLLIQEDMDVDIESAREIMKDSVLLGNLVNEEVEDVVTRLAEDE